MSNIKLHQKKKLVDYIFEIFNYIIFGVFTLMCIFPFYYIFINTISNNDLVSRGKILLYPKGIHFNNYVEIIKLQGIGRATLISISRTFIGTLLTIVVCSFLAYILTKKKMWGRKYWYRFVMITMYFNAGFIPIFLNIRRLGLLDNYLVYIIPGLVVPFYVILIKTYIESIPASLEESAQIDGAGYILIFVKIMLPLSVPILATISIFAAVGHWNQYLDTLFYINSSELYTLQFLLYQYFNELNALASIIAQNPNNANMDPSLLLTPTSIRMTVSMVVVLPIFFVYPFGQKYFMNGIMIGAVKG